MNQVAYTAVYAASKATGQIARSSTGAACVLTTNATQTAWSRRWFGTCGAAPTLARSLPPTICAQENPTFQCAQIASASPGGGDGAAAAAASPAQQKVTSTGYLKSPVNCNGVNYRNFTYQGVVCGNGFVQWNVAVTEDGCPLLPDASPNRVRYTQDVFGSCGVPPVLAPALPESACKPPPLPFVLQRTKVANGETVPENLKAIEAVEDGKVADVASLQSSMTEDQQVVVGVFDTGIDSTHLDLVYRGGANFIPDASNPGQDIKGHGTAVGGIIGAKNTGAGELQQMFIICLP